MKPLLAVAMLLVAAPPWAAGELLPEPATLELDNGAVLIVLEKHDVPLVGLEAVIRGGAITDPEGRAGLASLVAGLLEKGAGERDAAAFAEAVDGVGGSLTTSAGRESLSVSAEFLARDADLMLALVGDMLKAPHFDAGEADKLRDRRINLLRAARDNDPSELTPVYGGAFLFGGHPYGAPIDGDETSLSGLTAADVRDYYDRYVGANRLIVAVVGDVDATQMLDKLSAAFADWRSVEGELPDVAPPTPVTGRRVLLVDKPEATQSYFWIGNVGVGRDYVRRAELDIANTLFGGRFTSWLVDELRTRAGLTYSASSQLRRYAQPGPVAIVSYTKTESTVEAIDLAVSLLGRLHDTAFEPAMVESGRNYILGQYPPRLETAAQLAEEYATLEVRGLGIDYVNEYPAAIAAADAAGVRAAIADTYPPLDDLVFVVIGDAAAIREPIGKYGPVTEVPMTAPTFSP